MKHHDRARCVQGMKVLDGKQHLAATMSVLGSSAVSLPMLDPTAALGRPEDYGPPGTGSFQPSKHLLVMSHLPRFKFMRPSAAGSC